jgi:hypothetical protein
VHRLDQSGGAQIEDRRQQEYLNEVAEEAAVGADDRLDRPDYR